MSSLIFLNTRDSIYPDTPHRTTFEINNLRGSGIKGYRVSFQNVEVPNLVYPINSYNNRIYFSENGGSVLTATLTPNKYTGATLATEIKTQMDAAGTLTYTVSYDEQSEKLTISVVLPDEFEFVYSSTYYQYNAYEEMGFNYQNFTSGATFEGDAPINISGTQYVDLITSFATNNWSSSTTSSVLARIPMIVSFGNVIFYEPSSDDDLFVSETRLDSINIELRDDKGNQFVLPFNSNFNMVLKLIPVF